MRDLDMQQVWTPWEIHGSFHVLDWLRANAEDPLEVQDTDPFQAHVLTAWEIRDNDPIACELIRSYSYRNN